MLTLLGVPPFGSGRRNFGCSEFGLGCGAGESDGGELDMVLELRDQSAGVGGVLKASEVGRECDFDHWG